MSAHQPTKVGRKVVVVHRGARDAYQVSAGLAKAGLLEKLVTDLYSPNSISGLVPNRIARMIAARRNPDLDSRWVVQAPVSGLTSFVLEKCKSLPHAWRRAAIRRTDAVLGTKAGRLARKTNSFLLAYSYYGYHAFRSYGRPGALFQLHPHPASVREILRYELEQHPDCAPSLEKEWELALPEADYQRLVAEAREATQFLVASSFTRRTLIDNGADPESIRVVPYGVDCSRFSPGSFTAPAAGGRLKLLFVGTINQRKGIKYLLEALKLVGSSVELTVCGRVVDDLSLFKPFGSQIHIRPSVTFQDLVKAYQTADLFVFPSVAEGFAQVLLESLACGLPILSTTHTAAPDLITQGTEGFFVAPRRPDLLAERIDWAAGHRNELREMRFAARQRAEQFTWARFQAGVVSAVEEFMAHPTDRSHLGGSGSAGQGVLQHV